MFREPIMIFSLPRSGETHCWSNAALSILSAFLGITHLNFCMISVIELTWIFFNDSLVIVTVWFTTLFPFCITQFPTISHASLTFVAASLTSFAESLTTPVIFFTGLLNNWPLPVKI